MPIDALERERPRLPRLGKIRLGIRDKNQRGDEFPRKVDYFVVRPDKVTSAEAAAAFHEVYGEKPRELDVMFPVEDPDVFMPTWFKAYRATGLFCKGPGPDADGRPGVATRVFLGLDKDPTLAGLVPPDTKVGSMVDVPLCDPATCPYYAGDEKVRLCKQNAVINVLLPKVRGLGVWQIQTSSWNSIRNLRGGIAFVRALTGGRIAGIPLKLRLVPQEVQHDGRKDTAFVLQLAHDQVRLADVLAASRQSLAQLLLPPPEPDDDEIDEDLYPAAAAAQEAARAPNGKAATEVPATAPAPPSAPTADAELEAAMAALGWTPARRRAQAAAWAKRGWTRDQMLAEVRRLAGAGQPAPGAAPAGPDPAPTQAQAPAPAASEAPRPPAGGSRPARGATRGRGRQADQQTDPAQVAGQQALPLGDEAGVGVFF